MRWEIIRWRPVRSDSSEKNGGIGFDPAEADAVVEKPDQSLLLLFLRKRAVAPGVAESFEIGSCDLSNVFEPGRRGPAAELLLKKL